MDCLLKQGCIESLGHSSFACQEAKERLERKYGGTRRKVMVYLHALDNLKPIRNDHAKDVEKFADLLDIAMAMELCTTTCSAQWQRRC